ncbi:uncharacterized protein LOC127137402 [Lathyrus oleraceus]|uniref:uncharacterized protein LOC127137402 n=1 Tax=Pisum sativum TaxID=3888 RepID=UPI0021CEE4E8|nr:uncharacterized protein LOC127137402 [Pisum sativum]
MSQHQDTSASKNTKSTQKVSAPPMGIPDDEILDVVPLSVIPCKAIDLNQPIDASASACSNQGKFVASKTANPSYSEKHDDANVVIDLDDGSSDDQEESLLHHLKASVDTRMKTRKGRSMAELMSVRKAKKTVGIGPSKSWSKVEVKNRKVIDDSEYEEDVEEDVPDISLVKKTTVRKSLGKVPVVHLDNISFHLEDGAAKWKFVIQRRVAVERELGKDVVDVKEVMDLIKAVGLLKIVVGFSQCYECLVKEFIVNIPEDISDKNSKEFCKVYVRGRDNEGAGELEVTDNEVCREITARQVKGWPVKKHLLAGKLTVNHVEDIVMTSAMKRPASKVITELKETYKELGEGIRVATARKQSLEALIASLERAEGENTEHAKEAEAHTSSERSANNNETSGNSISGADEALAYSWLCTWFCNPLTFDISVND